MKRTFLQLCQTYDPKKHHIAGWFLSEKLDGQRCFWDGGISRGIPCREVPYANTVKDRRLVEEQIATGLWSRMAKVIHAPDWWLDQLPPIPLDGELWCGRKQNQKMASIVRSHGKTGWESVEYKILDSPPLETIFTDGEIEIRFGNEKYFLQFRNVMDWIKSRGSIETVKPDTPYLFVHRMLVERFSKLPGLVCLHAQEQISDPRILGERADEIDKLGGEGIVLRSHIYPWEACRSHACLKLKPEQDAEAVVEGYVWGKGKLQGMMGAMMVRYGAVRFELSGFTDAQRRMTGDDEGPGKPVSSCFENPMFPRGSVVTFKYRELSDTGVPKEARFLRLRESE